MLAGFWQYFDWQPGMGDPSLMGWLTVAAYYATALLCWLAARRAARPGRAVWHILALLMAVLGLVKQWNLLSAVTAAGRALALAQDWYAGRQALQLLCVAGVALPALLLLVWGVRRARGGWRASWLPLLGLLYLLAFVLVRATSLHQVDALLSLAPAGVRLNWLLEWLGIGLVAIPAGQFLRKAG